MSKYDPLKTELSRRPDSQLSLSFEDVERILGFPLPLSARRHRPWWANQNDGAHTQAHAWMDAGWKTWKADLARERVLFVRSGENSSRLEKRSGPSQSHGATVVVEVDRLSPAARRLINDYTVEGQGDMASAVTRAVHEAAVARRGRLVDEWIAKAPRMPPGEPDSVELIREDRDAR